MFCNNIYLPSLSFRHFLKFLAWHHKNKIHHVNKSNFWEGKIDVLIIIRNMTIMKKWLFVVQFFGCLILFHGLWQHLVSYLNNLSRGLGFLSAHQVILPPVNASHQMLMVNACVVNYIQIILYRKFLYIMIHHFNKLFVNTLLFTICSSWFF